jgi:hypothetical protein
MLLVHFTVITVFSWVQPIILESINSFLGFPEAYAHLTTTEANEIQHMEVTYIHF